VSGVEVVRRPRRDDYRANDEVWFESTPDIHRGVSIRISSAGENAIITGDMAPSAVRRPHWRDRRRRSHARRPPAPTSCATRQRHPVGTHFGGPSTGFLER
jgi:hypothetical protein